MNLPHLATCLVKNYGTPNPLFITYFNQLWVWAIQFGVSTDRALGSSQSPVPVLFSRPSCTSWLPRHRDAWKKVLSFGLGGIQPEWDDAPVTYWLKGPLGSITNIVATFRSQPALIRIHIWYYISYARIKCRHIIIKLIIVNYYKNL